MSAPAAPATELQTHLRQLHRLGLHAIPGWGGGKLLPGTDQRSLALDPPSLAEQLTADYSGGLIILSGTENHYGGYVAALDVDMGPAVWRQMPKGFLYAELGTRDTKRHIFVRTVDRLEGALNLFSGSDLVCELKGLNLSLRSWPTRPEGKPRGYMPSAFTVNPAADPPKLTARQLAEGLADYLSATSGQVVHVQNTPSHHGNGQAVPAGPELAAHIEAELERRNVRLRRPSGSGWQIGFCPFHDNTRTPAFSVNFALGWKCHAVCGSGSLRDLARRLGIEVRRAAGTTYRHGHHRAISVTVPEVRF
jgi:hypothetical protein